MPPPIEAAAAFGIAYREEREEDTAFLAELYASTRADEFAPFGWPAATLAAFLEQQRRAQQAHYRVVYPEAQWLIVEREERAVGRLYFEQRADSVHLIDISLLPVERGKGLGGALIADLVAYGEARGLPTSLQVQKSNPAKRLYQRLGFRVAADNGAYDWMERAARS